MRLCVRGRSVRLVWDDILCALHAVRVTKACLRQHYRKIIAGIVLLFMSRAALLSVDM